jgi:tetratricopeptide (TPR) repeat protein
MTGRSYADPTVESTARAHDRGRPRVPGSRSPWLALLVVVAACGSAPPAPREPSPATEDLLAQAEAAEKERHYDRAQALYTRARRQAPDAASGATAALAHGRALIFWGEYEQAEAALEEATRHAPDNPGAWHDLGMVRHERGDLPGAEIAFRRSIAASPRDGRPRLALAALLWKQHRHRDALREYEALASLDLPRRVHEQVDWAIATLRRLVEPPP